MYAGVDVDAGPAGGANGADRADRVAAQGTSIDDEGAHQAPGPDGLIAEDDESVAGPREAHVQQATPFLGSVLFGADDGGGGLEHLMQAALSLGPLAVG